MSYLPEQTHRATQAGPLLFVGPEILEDGREEIRDPVLFMAVLVPEM